MLKFQLIYVLCVSVMGLRAQLCNNFECNEYVFYGRESTCTLENLNCSEEMEFDEYTDTNDWTMHLYVRDSNIEYIPHRLFNKFENLRTLDVTDCNLRKITGMEFESATKLMYLNLTNNFLTELPASPIFADAHKLQHINLSHNQITRIAAPTFKSLSALTDLNLSYNKIGTIPENVFEDLIAIKVLDLSYNAIVVFDSCFGSVRRFSIDRFNLNFNRLTNFSLSAPVSIGHLTLNNNELCAIDLERNTIQMLEVDNNKLQNIRFARSIGLTKLSLRNNSLHDLNFMRNLTTLVYLDLSFNSAAGPSIGGDTFNVLSSLENLRLASVNLTRLDDQLFSNLIDLEQLDISYNDLNAINFHTLSSLHNLKRLYISGNNLTQIAINEFDVLFPKLVEIAISDNNWQCDQLVNMLRKFGELKVNLAANDTKRLAATGESNIRSIRCYSNAVDSNYDKKIPIERVYNNDGVDSNGIQLNETASVMNELQQQNADLLRQLEELTKKIVGKNNAAEFNQTRIQLIELQQQNENLKFNLTKLSADFEQARNETARGMDQANVTIRDFHNQIDLLRIKMNETNNLLHLRGTYPDHRNGDRVTGYELAGDIKFMKIFVIVFLMAAICMLAVKCYTVYFKQPRHAIIVKPTRSTNIEENNV